MPRLIPCLLLIACFATAAPADDLRVMSFNIRYGTADDGENHWRHRKESVAETIAAFDPDLLGTQEAHAFQKDYLAETLQGYTSFGVGRNHGDDRGEMCAIFYRTTRFETLDGGHFWLSETPDVPGSKSWDSSLPRMVSWLKLKDTRSAGEPILWFFNTHFDHRGEQARREAARLLRQRIATMTGGERAIVTGDFNADEGSVPYQNLLGDDDQGPSLLVDSFRVVHPGQTQGVGTFTGFDAQPKSNKRIDWLACTRDWTIRAADIDHTVRDGRTPSDHLPVTAVLAFPE